MARLAIISDHASPMASAGGTDSGGQNVYVANISRQLARLGWQVDVFTRRDDPSSPVIVDWKPGVRVINVPAGPPAPIAKEQLLPHMEAFTNFIQAFIAAEQLTYDVVHANFFMSGWVGLQLQRRLALPLVMTFHCLGKVRRAHQGDRDLFPDERFAIEETIVREADVIVAECPQDRADLISLYAADPAQIEVVPCGFDAEELMPMDRTRSRERLAWERNQFAILQLGRMVPRKGVDNVIRALAVLRRQAKVDAHLYVVGGNTDAPDANATPEIGRLLALAESLEVSEHVNFGRRDRSVLALHYSAADVFVSTPWYEPFGITPLEAMACAIPVVGAAVGGIKHTVLDGKTGFLVRPKDPEALARRLALLAGNPGLCAKMGAAGWARVQRSFTWTRVARRLGAVYRRVSSGMPVPDTTASDRLRADATGS
jgi:glycosyltransferase involved in cell wall biosynthesis